MKKTNIGKNILNALIMIGLPVLIYLLIYKFFTINTSVAINPNQDNFQNVTEVKRAEDSKQSPNLDTNINAQSTSSVQVKNEPQISRQQLAEGLIALQNSEISIPQELTLSEYEKLMASSTLSKKQVAISITGGVNSPDYTETLDKIFAVGSGFVARGGDQGLQIFMPGLENVLDDRLISEGQTLIRVDINSITDKNGQNILDSESPFEQGSFFNKLVFEKVPQTAEYFDKYYKADRVLRLKGDVSSIRSISEIKKISGTVVVNLPISVKKYDLSLDQIVTKSKIKAGNVTVGVSEVKEGGLYLNIKGTSKSILYIKCFDDKGTVIATAVVSAIDPDQFSASGFNKQAILNFNLSELVDHVEIYAPSEVVAKKYPFVI